MPTLIDALLAQSVVTGPQGITSIVNRIADRTEFACPIPSEFPVMLALIFADAPDSVFDVSVEVRSHVGTPLWFDSGRLATPPSGRGEFAFAVPVPVRDVGPCVVSLRFNGDEVWSHRMFFARSSDSSRQNLANTLRDSCA